ncbi:MAG: rod shape-determining protein MreC [Peptostreptococcaceae bacterium]|nr:rod shape-determining protein MreC [Peptostreptococcaceae bacterium]
MVIFVFNEIFGNSFIKRVLNPILKTISRSSDRIVAFVDQKYVHDEKDIRIKELEEENAKLRRQLIDNTISEKELQDLNDLKKILNHKEEKIYKSHITADLIAKDANAFYTSFLISAGESDGVKRGDLVLSGNGLAGIVQDTQKDYSKVLSILDSQISISFKAVREDAVNGIASQNINVDAFSEMPSGMLKGYIFDNADVLVGDILITSGMGVYPAGIEIGEVYQVIEDRSNLLKYVIIKPYTNFNELNKLLVVNTRILE